jgi:quinol monooxygenase YgiN
LDNSPRLAGIPAVGGRVAEVEESGPQNTDPVLVTMRWERVNDALLAHIVRYVVMSRGEPGCRNIDLCASMTTEGRVVIVEKWATLAAQQAHLDGETMLALAASARDLDAARPELDLLAGISAHDLN